MSAAADPILLRHRPADGVAWLTLNRPAARNALSFALMAELEAALDEAEAARDVRVIVLAGAGPAFCAGHDLREVRAPEAVGGARDLDDDDLHDVRVAAV